jgi:molybdopterin-biosynthesis enzyme MoeA-like protein
LLSGKIADCNVAPLARLLRSKGISLERVIFRGDDVVGIAADVRALSGAYTWVFTSGGVGPTHDDVTIEAVAQAFDTEVVSDPSLEGLLRAHYKERCTAGHLRMALVPKTAALVATEGHRWPTVRLENTWILPGVPEAFRMKLALLSEVLPASGAFVSEELFATLDEPHLLPALDAVVAAFPNVAIGSYPKWFDDRYKTKITFDGRDGEAVRGAKEAFAAQLPAGALIDRPTNP